MSASRGAEQFALGEIRRMAGAPQAAAKSL